jgi:hypothetical protein
MWKLAADFGPSPRHTLWMAYDSDRAVAVLFGGIATGPGNPSNTPLADTWEWDEHVWRQREDMGPSPRLGAALAYIGPESTAG